jgi:hypothetical protein
MTPTPGEVAPLIDPDRPHLSQHSMPPPRGEGMTDSPQPGLSTPGKPDWNTHPITHHRPREQTTPFSPPSTACAVRRRRQGPPAATRSTSGRSLTPTPTQARPNLTEKTTRKITTPRKGLDRPRSYRDDVREHRER